MLVSLGQNEGYRVREGAKGKELHPIDARATNILPPLRRARASLDVTLCWDLGLAVQDQYIVCLFGIPNFVYSTT